MTSVHHTNDPGHPTNDLYPLMTSWQARMKEPDLSEKEQRRCSIKLNLMPFRIGGQDNQASVGAYMGHANPRDPLPCPTRGTPWHWALPSLRGAHLRIPCARSSSHPQAGTTSRAPFESAKGWGGDN